MVPLAPYISFLLLRNKLPQSSCLKQHTVTILKVVLGQKSGPGLVGSSAQSPTTPLNHGIRQAAGSRGGLTGEESASPLIQVVGRINFLVVCDEGPLVCRRLPVRRS